MAGVKRSVDSAEDRNGKRTKTKLGSAVKKSKSDAPAKKSDSSKKDKKSSKKDQKPSKKKVEESEEEDDFDIDDVSDSGDDLDALDDSPANDVEMDDVEEEDSEENSDESEKKSPKEIQAKSMSGSHILWGLLLLTIFLHRQCLSRVPRQTKGSPTGAQGRQTQRRYDRPLKEAVGTTASQVPRSSRATQETYQRTVRDYHRPSSRLRFQARLCPCYSNRPEIRKSRAAQGNCTGVEG